MFLLASLLKKFALILVDRVNILVKYPAASVQYFLSSRIYEYYFSLYSYVYKELVTNYFFSVEEFSNCYYLQRESYRRIVKLRKWTQLFLIVRWRRLINRFKFRRLYSHSKRLAFRFSFFMLRRFR